MKKILLLLLLTFGLTVQAQEDHTGKVRLLDVSQGTKSDSLLTYSSKKEIRYFKISDLLSQVSNTLSFSNGQLTSLNGNTVDLDSYYYSQTEVDALVSGAGGALEFITEGGNTGIAIKGRNPDNYADIGERAVDLSFSSSASTTMGASGNYSFVTGLNNKGFDYSKVSGINNTGNLYSDISGSNNTGGIYARISGANNVGGIYANITGRNNYAPSHVETVFGTYGTNYTPNSTTTNHPNDRLFSLANGSDASNRNLALVVYKSGTAILDGELTADNFIKTGGTGNDILLADGTTTPLSGIGGGLALGETSSTAYRGDRGKIAYDHSQITSGNPHNVTASDVNLGNVDNTSDTNKPISTLTQSALNGKANNTIGVFSTSIEAPIFKIGLWELKVVGNNLEFHYNNVAKARLNSTGILEAIDHKNGL